MIDGVFPPDPEQLQMVMRRLDRLNRLVDDLHLLSLARAGHLVLDKSRFHLDEVVSECLSWAAPQLEKSVIRVNKQIDLAHTVEADRYRLGQVFAILIDNVLRYAADGGRLDVSASINSGYVTTEFSDRGPGIDPPTSRADVRSLLARGELARASFRGQRTRLVHRLRNLCRTWWVDYCRQPRWRRRDRAGHAACRMNARRGASENPSENL